MRLDCGEGYGASLARRTSHSTARISIGALILRAYRAVAFLLLSAAKAALPTVTVSTDRGSN
jgi:hypothetical protein